MPWQAGWQEPYAECTALAEAVDRAEAKDLAALWQHVGTLAAECCLPAMTGTTTREIRMILAVCADWGKPY